MKKNLLNGFLVLILAVQISLQYTDLKSVKGEYKSAVISSAAESSEALTSSIRFTLSPVCKVIEYKLAISFVSEVARKGNSLFYLMNQLLPRNISESRILATFFTSNFSSAV